MASMSALGQKQTCAVQDGMSALPPKASLYTVRGLRQDVPLAFHLSDYSMFLRLASSTLCVFSDRTSCRLPSALRNSLGISTTAYEFRRPRTKSDVVLKVLGFRHLTTQ